MKKLNIAQTIVSFLVVGLIGPASVFAATSPSLGTAATFGILSSTYTPTIANTTITGDLGYTTLSSGLFFTVSGSTYTDVSGVPAGAVYQQAGIDQSTALNTGPDGLNVQTCTPITGTLDAVDLDGAGPMVPGHFVPGCYAVTGAMNITATTNIYLDGAGTYIFKSTAALTTGADSKVILNGASACDVFWAPAGATSLGANSTFIGTDIDAAGISIGDTVNWVGRALAFGGTILSNHDIISIPTSCTPVTPTPTPVVTRHSQTALPTPIVPIIGVIKVPTPLALPAGPGKVTYNYTVWNVGGLQALRDVSLIDDKCSQIRLLTGDINGNNLLDPGETWKYDCTANLTSTTTNTAIATGYSNDPYHTATIATAVATVVVGTPIQPPLINVVKVPSQLTPFPYGGGNVTFTYTVTNPGVVAMHNVSANDDKCSPVSFVSGDTNGNNLLDPGENWVYTCTSNIKVSTGNVATARGDANGLTAVAYSFVNVLVSSPELPNTGFSPAGFTISWLDIILAIAVIVLAIWLIVVSKKGKRRMNI